MFTRNTKKVGAKKYPNKTSCPQFSDKEFMLNGNLWECLCCDIDELIVKVEFGKGTYCTL